MLIGGKRPLDAVMESTKVKVSVKWGKELFSDVLVDLDLPPLMFKTQLFALSAVPPDRQKVMIKGGLLKDEEWGKQVPKEGATVMLMGSAEAVPVEAPAQAPIFVEDLPESEQANLETKAYGSGLENLGNTCYMNSTLQCLYAIEPLRDALLSYQPQPPSADLDSQLSRSARELFSDMQKGGEPFAPFAFLMTLRKKFPQFAQQAQGGFMQQDAEECWTNLVYTFREKLKGPDAEAQVDSMMAIGTKLQLKCEESGEQLDLEPTRSYMLRCNIDGNISHLHEGLLLGLKDDRERMSEKLGTTALFKGTSCITSLPRYLTVQMMRFFFRTDTQTKTKMLRKVSYGLELDVYDMCSTELKQQLDGPRAALKVHRDMLAAQSKAKKVAAAGGSLAAKAMDAAKPAAAAAASASAPAAAAAPAADVEMQDAAGPSSSSTSSHVGAITGKYELVGCVTHKGRTADSGHYVAWVKQKDGRWVLFDDETLSFKKDEDILALDGGGDWHIAYLLLYRAVTVPGPAAAAL